VIARQSGVSASSICSYRQGWLALWLARYTHSYINNAKEKLHD